MSPRLYRVMDVLFTDVNDSRILLGIGEPGKAAEGFLKMGPETVVVKNGGGGGLRCHGWRGLGV